MTKHEGDANRRSRQLVVKSCVERAFDPDTTARELRGYAQRWRELYTSVLSYRRQWNGIAAMYEAAAAEREAGQDPCR
jgi:hypothetical protein